jgi:hypothetical protein
MLCIIERGRPRRNGWKIPQGKRGRRRLITQIIKRMKDQRTYKIIGAALEVHKEHSFCQFIATEKGWKIEQW